MNEDLLRSRGLRATRPRLAVLEILHSGGHLDVDEIIRRVRQRLDSVSTQAVYDVLGALARAGLARRIEPAGCPALFEARVDCAVGAAPCLDLAQTAGFEVDEAEVTFWGLCPTCQSRRETG